MRPLFTQERVAASAGLFLDGLLGEERRKMGGCGRKRPVTPIPGGRSRQNCNRSARAFYARCNVAQKRPPHAERPLKSPTLPSPSPGQAREGRGRLEQGSGVPAEGLLLALRALAQLDVDEAGTRRLHHLVEGVADILRVLDIG